MTTKPKIIQTWTVRNSSGQYLGNVHAYIAEQAIAKVVASDNATASTFRRSQPASLKLEQLTAKVES